MTRPCSGWPRVATLVDLSPPTSAYLGGGASPKREIGFNDNVTLHQIFLFTSVVLPYCGLAHVWHDGTGQMGVGLKARHPALSGHRAPASIPAALHTVGSHSLWSVKQLTGSEKWLSGSPPSTGPGSYLLGSLWQESGVLKLLWLNWTSFGVFSVLPTGKIGLNVYFNGFQIMPMTLRGQSLMLDFSKI